MSDSTEKEDPSARKERVALIEAGKQDRKHARLQSMLKQNLSRRKMQQEQQSDES